jgi:hypothetical protein
MGQRDYLTRWWGRAAIAAFVLLAFVLLILAAGLCCLDQGQSAMDDHSMLMGFCFLMLVVPAVIPLLAGPPSRGFAVNLLRPAFAAVPLSVPKPPPRPSRFA